MNCKKLLLIPLLFAVSAAYSQTDSLVVVNAEWQSKKINRGIKLKTYCFNKNLFNANQNVTILEVKPGRRNKIDLAFEPEKLKKTSQFGQEANAIAAINGTFFDVRNGGSVDYIRSNGVMINRSRPDKNQKRTFHQRAAIALDNGRISICHWDGTKNWEDNLRGEDIMVTGPALITNSRRVRIDSISFAVARHPRSAVAIKGKKVLLVTVDGRNENSAGMNLFELADLLKWLEADQAINLDGGGSTTLWVNSEPGNGVINYPSDNKKWDHEGERKVANVLLVKRD